MFIDVPPKNDRPARGGSLTYLFAGPLKVVPPAELHLAEAIFKLERCQLNTAKAEGRIAAG
jgi:hypothetical protein